MNLLCWGAIVDSDNNYWMPIYNTDELIKGSNGGTYDYIESLNFREYSIDEKCILKAFDVEDRILLFARTSYDVWIVDKLTNKLTHQKYYDGVSQEIADIVQCGKNAVIFPYHLDNPIIIWDIDSHIATALQCNKRLPINQFAFVRGISIGESVYSATRSLNGVYLCRVDIKDRKTLFFETKLRMVNAIDIKEDNIWLFGLSSDNKTVFQKYKNDMRELIEQHIISDIEPVLENGNMKFFRMCAYKDKIVLIPSSSERIYVYDLQTDDGHYLEYPDNAVNGILNKGASFVEIQCIGCDIILFPFGFDRIMKLNLEDEKISTIKILLEPEVERVLNTNIVISSDVLCEGYPMPLNEFIKTI